MNVVIYCRYSSHAQNEQSIEGQLKTCYDFCEKNKHIIVAEYIDRAVSGTTDNRPEFQRMVEDSAKKHFQGVVVYQLDRFARNRYDSAIYKAKLKKNEVRVLSARENISNDPSGILVEGLLESMAEYYSAELSQKIRRGMDINAQKCLCIGGKIALGFKVDSEKRFQIDEAIAPFVVKIFEMYAGGKPVVEITEYLNAQKLQTSIGGTFNKNSLRRMLQNKRYLGIYTYKDIEIPDGIPRIIDDELFAKVQKRLEINKKAPARGKAKEEFILTTKLFCGHCREMMVGVSGTGRHGKIHSYYSCNSSRKKLCKKKNIRKKYIEDFIITQCSSLLTTENISKIAREVVAVCERERDNPNLKRLGKLLKENDKATMNLIKALELGEISDIVSARIQEKRKERAEIEKQITIEKLGQVNITEPEIKFFLTQLRKGNVDDLRYRKTLVNIFVNAIYLYDDKITLILNSGGRPVKVNEGLLEEIEQADDTFITSKFKSSIGNRTNARSDNSNAKTSSQERKIAYVLPPAIE